MTPTMVLREGQATHSVIPVRETWPSLKGTAAGDFPGLEKLKGRELPRPAVTIDPSNLWKGAGLNKIKEAEAALPVAWEKSSWDDEPTEFDRSSLRQIAVQEQRLKELPTRFRLNEAAGEWEAAEKRSKAKRYFEDSKVREENLDVETGGMHSGKHLTGASGGSGAKWYVQSVMTPDGYDAMEATGALRDLAWRGEAKSSQNLLKAEQLMKKAGTKATLASQGKGNTDGIAEQLAEAAALIGEMNEMAGSFGEDHSKPWHSHTVVNVPPPLMNVQTSPKKIYSSAYYHYEESGGEEESREQVCDTTNGDVSMLHTTVVTTGASPSSQDATTSPSSPASLKIAMSPASAAMIMSPMGFSQGSNALLSPLLSPPPSHQLTDRMQAFRSPGSPKIKKPPPKPLTIPEEPRWSPPPAKKTIGEAVHAASERHRARKSASETNMTGGNSLIS